MLVALANMASTIIVSARFLKAGCLNRICINNDKNFSESATNCEVNRVA